MMRVEFKGSHFERDVVLSGVRWYVAYAIGCRQIEEMMGERGVAVDHSTLHRWVLKYVPVLETAFVARKRPLGGSWRLDETYVRVKGAWKYLYHAVDKTGATVDFLLTATRDHKAEARFLPRPSAVMVFRSRSRSTRAAPTRPRLQATTPIRTPMSRSARSNISTTSLNRITW
jgi:transposase-like protein